MNGYGSTTKMLFSGCAARRPPRRNRTGDDAPERALGPIDPENGRSDRIRTYDPLVPNEVRYQAALHSDICGEKNRRALEARLITSEFRCGKGQRQRVFTRHATAIILTINGYESESMFAFLVIRAAPGAVFAKAAPE
jgi:hypothetical protein